MNSKTEPRFHWRLVQGGERDGASRSYQASLRETGLPDLVPQIDFCRLAEQCGIDSLLVDFGWAKPDPILLSAALGSATKKIKLIVAYRSGLLCPTSFVQQLNTLSQLIQGRFSLNIVAGNSPQEQRYYGDFLSHDERYDRTEEFLAVCNAFWSGNGDVNYQGRYYQVENGKLNTPFYSEERAAPEIYLAGNSEPAKRVAITQGTCWMRFPERHEELERKIQPVLESGKEVGLRFSIFARSTREEAIEAAYALVQGIDPNFNDRTKEKEFAVQSDSVSVRSMHQDSGNDWLTNTLWTGAARTHGPAAIALVGSPIEIAATLRDYHRIGVTQFIISGWPKRESMEFFSREILPLVTARQDPIACNSPEERKAKVS